MNEKEQWTPEEERLLCSKRLLDEISKGAESGNPKQDRPIWQVILESSAFTAFVTVAVGGIIGQLIVVYVQARHKEREQSLLRIREFSKQENETVAKVFGLIGDCLVSSDDLVISCNPEFDLRNFQGADQDEVKAQRKAIRENFNLVDRRWRAERDRLGFLLVFYARTDQGLFKRWRTVQDNVSLYMDHSRNAFLSFKDGAGTPDRYQATREQLKNEKQELRFKLEEFTDWLRKVNLVSA